MKATLFPPPSPLPPPARSSSPENRAWFRYGKVGKDRVFSYTFERFFSLFPNWISSTEELPSFPVSAYEPWRVAVWNAQRGRKISENVDEMNVRGKKYLAGTGKSGRFEFPARHTRVTVSSFPRANYRRRLIHFEVHFRREIKVFRSNPK